MFYRKDPKEQPRVLVNLIGTTFIVGFLVSLLEAVCTGQVYLPTIVFILKEPNLRLRAMFYLLLYNFMFIAPLLLILILAIIGKGSKKIEGFFRDRIALIKLFMFILFLGLGVFLIVGV
jgi:cytochrome c biogenesis protein CcdA